MKIIIALLICLSTALSPVWASEKEDLRKELLEANDIVIAVGVCNFTYDNRANSKLIELFENHNFDVEQYSIKNDILDTQLILTRYYSTLSQKAMYIVSFRGSSNKKDWRLNFKYGKVPYDSSVKIAAGEDLPNDIPLVHRGFNEYVNIALNAKDSSGTNISDLIINDKNADVIITGHSLGGAVAALYASRLLDKGLEPERLRVITFGAPAVGNKIYADKYQDKIDLIRVVTNQDLIPTILKSVGGYTHFGKLLKLPADPRIFDYFDQHEQGFYFHQAIKYYFDTEDKAIAAGIIPAEPLRKITPGKPLVAIHTSSTPEAKKLADFKYMPRVVIDQLHSMLPSYTTMPVKDPSPNAKVDFGVIPEYIELAKKDGAKFLLLTQLDIASDRSKERKSVILNYIIIDLDTENVIATASLSSSLHSRNSMLQTLIYDIAQLPFKIFI